MIFFKPNICFKVKTLEETANDFVNRLKNSNNAYEISTLKNFLSCKDYSLDEVKFKLKNEHNLTVLQGEKQLQSIKSYWLKIEERFFNILSEVLDFNMFGEVQAYCFLDCMPLPCVDFSVRKISLSIHESLNNNVRFALSFMVKFFVLKKFMGNSEVISFDYSKDSVYWIMADLVADCLFYHTDLKIFAENTAYKYYYGLKISDINVIDYLRNVYPTMNILDFMSFVFDIVNNNMAIFTKFTNRY